MGDATPAVERAIESGLLAPQATVRALAVAALGERRESALPLTRAASDPDPRVRRAAVAALGRLPSDGSEGLSALLLGLADADPEVRGEAARSLGRRGRAAADALPALERARGDPDPRVAAIASRAAVAVLGP